MQIKKPETFEDLLYLQSILDKEVAKTRDSGFVPRKRTETDILLSLDDEFQEWLRELPYEYNFKTWKQKEYNREKELEELTDILFFILQWLNTFSLDNMDNIDKLEEIEYLFDEFEGYYEINLLIYIESFKEYLWGGYGEIDSVFGEYIGIVKERGFTKNELLNTYWEKWQKNMERINGDWTFKK